MPKAQQTSGNNTLRGSQPNLNKQVAQKTEYRMSNAEFRMTKLNGLFAFLRPSSFVIQYSAVRF
jgi:hypothetical protein